MCIKDYKTRTQIFEKASLANHSVGVEVGGTGNHYILVRWRNGRVARVMKLPPYWIHVLLDNDRKNTLTASAVVDNLLYAENVTHGIHSNYKIHERYFRESCSENQKFTERLH